LTKCSSGKMGDPPCKKQIFLRQDLHHIFHKDLLRPSCPASPHHPSKMNPQYFRISGCLHRNKRRLTCRRKGLRKNLSRHSLRKQCSTSAELFSQYMNTSFQHDTEFTRNHSRMKQDFPFPVIFLYSPDLLYKPPDFHIGHARKQRAFCYNLYLIHNSPSL